MKISEIPNITDQQYYNQNEATLNGWYFIYRNKLLTIENILLFSSYSAVYIFLTNGKLYNPNGFCVVTNFPGNGAPSCAEVRITNDEEKPCFFKKEFTHELIWMGKDFQVNPKSEVVSEKYSKDNKIHRLDGPAIVTHEGRQDYYVNGERLTFEDFSIHPEVLSFKHKQVILDIIRES